jgi:thioredoxin reductase
MTASRTDIAIIGAGPYGLSIAAHLSARRLDLRVFGKPMSVWRGQMPAGTLLKSFGFASNLYEPSATFTLAHFCREQGLPYADAATPIPIETFIAYGLEFQKRFVPNLEETDIVSLKRAPDGFLLTTESGELVHARRVVLAVGISHFGYTPPELAALPPELATHSSMHTHVGKFSGKTVAVIGGGASAGDLAGLLHEAGAEVHLIARRKSIRFYGPPGTEPRPVLQRILRPRSGLGQGWRARLSADHPLVFHAMPRRFRVMAVRSINAPASSWYTGTKVLGHVNMHLGASVNAAQPKQDAVQLQLRQLDGASKELEVNHVIAATGYKPSLQALEFLDPQLRDQIEAFNDAPILSTSFETSVPGLYVVGLASAVSFGPLCRFAYGAKFTAKRITQHLAAATSSSPTVLT